MGATHELGSLLHPANRWEQGTPELMVGSVLSFTQPTTSVACTASVDFEGQGNGTPCLSLDSYTDATPAPAVGDIILAVTNGADTYILGRIS